MFDHPVLDQLVLGYSPIIDRQRAVVSTRLTLFPARPDAAPDVGGQLEALQLVWPPPIRNGGPPLALRPLTPVSLNLAGEALLQAAEDRRGPASLAPGVRQVSTVRAGVRTTADVDAAFCCGAVAVQGWPFDDAPPAAGTRVKVATDIQVVMELIQGVDRNQPVAQLDAVLKRDPTLAFRLLRYLNSPALGLRAEVTSFGHAILMLGHLQLKRWLSVLLASSSVCANAKPLFFAAVRRGLLMEELGRALRDAELRGEMFICGVFSLLDKLLQQPFGDLLQCVPVPDRVRQTLMAAAGTERGGPYSPHLELVGAIERESLFDIRECSERLLLGPGEVNRALLSALRHAQLLDG